MPPTLESLRIHQWSKNLLLAVPAVVGQAAGNPGVARNLVIACLAGRPICQRAAGKTC